jgi:hypothetical protein
MRTSATFAFLLACAATPAPTGSVQARALSDLPTPGTRGYTYTVIETVNGGQLGYRMAFDLVTDDAGATDALILSAEETSDGKTFHPVVASDACKTAMHAPSEGVARVRLWPPGGNVGLGPDFLDTCAPAGVFFPLTDILNVVVIPFSQRFAVQNLHRPGDKGQFAGFSANYDRAGETLKQITPGGEVTLVSLSNQQAVIDWSPAPAELDLTNQVNGQPVNLTGLEHWAFRLTLDLRTGALIEAHTPYDTLDLVTHMAGVPADKAPPVKITRTVEIKSR